MNKNDVINFFNRLAPSWDADMIRSDRKIGLILDHAGVRAGKHILDVACGTGVLFPDYKKRKVASVTGIDISRQMVNIAKSKFPEYDVICDDAETYYFEKKYDAVMIYNAFPHFINAERLIENLSKAIKIDGRLTVAHGMSKEVLEKCHSDKAKNISLPLSDKEEISALLSSFFDVDIMISDSRMFVVSGTKK